MLVNSRLALRATCAGSPIRQLGNILWDILPATIVKTEITQHPDGNIYLFFFSQAME